MERKAREQTNCMEALFQAFRQKMGDSYQIEAPEGARKETIFKIIKDGEQEGIILHPNSKKIQLCLLCKGAEKTAAVLEREYQKKRNRLGTAYLNGTRLSMIKDQIVFSVVSREEYLGALAHIPYKAFQEMVIVFQIAVQNGKERYARMINNEDMESWGITVEELMETARYNTPRLEPPYAIKLKDEEGVWNLFHQEWHKKLSFADKKIKKAAKSKFPVLGLFSKRNAANCIFYPDVLKRIADIWDMDVIVILGTKMDCYVCPKYFYTENPRIVNQMTVQIRESNAREAVFLAKQVYQYSQSKEKLEKTEQCIQWDRILFE